MLFSLILKLASKLTPFIVSLRKPYSAPRVQCFIKSTIERVGGRLLSPWGWGRSCTLPVGTPLSSRADTSEPRRENPPTGRFSSCRGKKDLFRNCANAQKGRVALLPIITLGHASQKSQWESFVIEGEAELGHHVAKLYAPVKKLGLLHFTASSSSATPLQALSQSQLRVRVPDLTLVREELPVFTLKKWVRIRHLPRQGWMGWLKGHFSFLLTGIRLTQQPVILIWNSE